MGSIEDFGSLGWYGWMEARLPARRLGARRGVDMLGEDEELMCGSGGNEEEGKA
jgi:hypothetical protein